MTEPFEIRRRASLYLGVGLIAAALAVALGFRAYDREQPVLWIVAAVLAVISYVHLIAGLDARMPLFVADDKGVRLRSGSEWVGFRWNDMGDIRIEGRDGIFHDPRVKVMSADGSRVYSAPLGFATTASPAEAEVQLAQRRWATSY